MALRICQGNVFFHVHSFNNVLLNPLLPISPRMLTDLNTPRDIKYRAIHELISFRSETLLVCFHQRSKQGNLSKDLLPSPQRSGQLPANEELCVQKWGSSSLPSLQIKGAPVILEVSSRLEGKDANFSSIRKKSVC